VPYYDRGAIEAGSQSRIITSAHRIARRASLNIDLPSGVATNLPDLGSRHPPIAPDGKRQSMQSSRPSH
jgi:hypothetical protein